MSSANSHPLGSIGFIGLGAMGGRMVRNIRGASRLMVHDADRGRADEVARSIGAHVAGSVLEMGDVETVILMLPDSNVVDSVFSGRNGDSPSLLSALKPGARVIDMSSATPARTVENAAIARRHGLTFVDAPVSGGIGGAEAGTLAIMVGAEPADFAAIKPILDCMGAHVTHVGKVGSGHAVKALNNLLGATIFAATSEVFAAGEKFGLDPAIMQQVINASSGSSYMTNVMWPKAILPKTWDFGFALRLMNKDVGIAMSLIDETGTDTAVVKAGAKLWSDAVKVAPANADMSELAKQYRQSVGL